MNGRIQNFVCLFFVFFLFSHSDPKTSHPQNKPKSLREMEIYSRRLHNFKRETIVDLYRQTQYILDYFDSGFFLKKN